MARTRIPLVVGNWKMNGLAASLAELEAVAGALDDGRAGDAVCAICLPATLISRAVETVGSRLQIGGQDCASEASGAHTGDIAAEMLRDAGASLVIVGHSERRHDHGETDELVRDKAVAALRAGLDVILCVGDTRAQHDASEALAAVAAQLAGSLPKDATAARVVIAYEPVWAIGTGLIPTETDVARMHEHLRGRLTELMPGQGAAMRILYGGSVKPDNAANLMAVDHVDGALIGGASLSAEEFLAIAAVYR